MFTLELTELEQKQLIELIDAAVKHIGVQAGGVAFNLAVKIQNAKSIENTPDAVIED